MVHCAHPRPHLLHVGQVALQTGLGQRSAGPRVDPPPLDVGLPGRCIDVVDCEGVPPQPGSRLHVLRRHRDVGALGRQQLPGQVLLDPGRCRPAVVANELSDRASEGERCSGGSPFEGRLVSPPPRQRLAVERGRRHCTASVGHKTCRRGVEAQALAEARLQFLLGGLGTPCRVVPVLPAVAVAADLHVPARPRPAWLLPADDLAQRAPLPVPERVAVWTDLLRSIDRAAWSGGGPPSRRADDRAPDRPPSP